MPSSLIRSKSMTPTRTSKSRVLRPAISTARDLIRLLKFHFRRWEYVAPMNVMRSRVALVSNMGKLWAIGGYDGVSNLSSVEVYDPRVDKWFFVEPMCAHEGGVGAGVIIPCS